MTRTRDKILVACIVAALTVCSAASADPPSRVGRLNLIQGGVSFRLADMEEWTAARRNYPLTAGNSLWTDEASQAEVHVGSTAIRLGPGTELGFLELDDWKVRLNLPQGLLNVRLRQLDPDETFEVDTPKMSVALVGPGSYRIEVRDSGDTQATVNEGEIEAIVDGLSYSIRAHQTAFATWDDPLSIQKASGADSWDRWCAERDRREDRLASVKYVPRAMIGCEDLDWYGRWSETPEYGAVWIPSSLPAGWAPYKFGHWAWVQPWGWTWIDDMPWGFAPFHYGRWALFRGIWVWVPGSIAHRPVYAPALVVFVGSGPSGAVLNGKIGWFPLAPGEAYVPPYRASRAYIQRVNIRHVGIGDIQKLPRVRVGGGTAPVVQQREAVRAPAPVVQQRQRARAPAPAAIPWVNQLFRVAERVLRDAPENELKPQVVQRAPELKRAPKEQAHQNSPKRQKVRIRKRLPNGQWVWVEEWVEE